MVRSIVTALTLVGAAMIAAPASAGRTVIDAGAPSFVAGYCSPLAMGTADCSPKALGFSLTFGTQTFDTFVVHSNGVLALGGALDYAGKPSTLSGFKPPAFSPLLDTSSYYEQDPSVPGFGKDDGAFVADYKLAENQLSLRWYTCTSRIFCGARSVSSIFYDGGLTREQVELRQKSNWSLMTLTKLDDGFSVNYDYTPRYDFVGREGVPSTQAIHFGYNLPTGGSEQDGAAVSRTFFFDNKGALIAGAVPEPATWLTMLVGFGLLGSALRRARASGMSAFPVGATA